MLIHLKFFAIVYIGLHLPNEGIGGGIANWSHSCRPDDVLYTSIGLSSNNRCQIDIVSSLMHFELPRYSLRSSRETVRKCWANNTPGSTPSHASFQCRVCDV